MFVRSTWTLKQVPCCRGGFPQTPRFVPLALASRPPQIMNYLTSSERKRETLAAGAVARRTADEQRRTVQSPTGRASLSTFTAVFLWSSSAVLASPPRTPPSGEASWLGCSPPPLQPSTVVNIGADMPRWTSRNIREQPWAMWKILKQTRSCDQTQSLEHSVGWWAAASRPGESRTLLAMDYFRLLTQGP
jgi:hypothetical protein